MATICLDLATHPFGLLSKIAIRLVKNLFKTVWDQFKQTIKIKFIFSGDKKTRFKLDLEET